MGSTCSRGVEKVGTIVGRRPVTCLRETIVVGLDYAGKSTILSKLNLGTVVTWTPIICCQVEQVEHNNTRYSVWDIGGEVTCTIRTIWRMYYEDKRVQGVVFVVDASDRERSDYARDHMHRLLNEEVVRDAPLLIFANKQDKPNALSTEEVIRALGVDELLDRPMAVQSCCATSGEGLNEGMGWLADVSAK